MGAKFVVIEGPDGCGKSTVIEELKKHFEKKHDKPVFTREPGGTRIGEQIRDILLDNANSSMTKYTEAYLYAAARLQHTEEFILPNIKKGRSVISDRFTMASVCYQGYGRERDPEFIYKLNSLAEDMIGEINYIVMMISPEEGLLRKKGQKVLDRMEREDIDFHRRVFLGYEDMIRRTGAVRIDATGTVEENVKSVLKALKSVGINI